MGDTPYQEQVLRTAGLLHYWTFDGDSLVSRYGGIDLTATNPPSYVAGQVGPKAAQFDGSNDCAYSSANIDLTGTNKICIMAWVKWLAYDATLQKFVWEFGTTGAEVGTFQLQTRGDLANDPVLLRWVGSAGQGFSQYFPATHGIVAGTFYHIATVVDLSKAAASEGDLYLNGVLKTPDVSTPLENAGNFANLKLYLGGRNNVSNFSNVVLDEVALFDITTGWSDPAANISAIYQATARRHGIWGKSIGKGLVA